MLKQSAAKDWSVRNSFPMRVKGRVLDMSGPSSQSLTYMLYELYEASSIEAGHGTALETRRASEQPRDCSGFGLLQPLRYLEQREQGRKLLLLLLRMLSSRCWRSHGVAVTTFQIPKWSRPGRKSNQIRRLGAPRSLDWLRLPRLEIRLSKETPATPGAPAVMAQAQQAQARSFGL